MALPCWHREQVIEQVPRTIELLNGLDILHPDILLQHSINPDDYHKSLVLRSAIESIRGTYIASSTVGRQTLIQILLEDLYQVGQIAGYKQTSGSDRYDFEIAVRRNPDYFAALEVKGGEGNSINISERPLWATEFGIWCHLDGAIVNQPRHGAHSIINRVTNEMVRRQKLVDVLFFKDALCGTSTRPCPKYPGQETTIGINVAPDIFLLPQRIPTLEDTEPPVHTLDTLELPRIILGHFKVDPSEQNKHIWQVFVRLGYSKNGGVIRKIEVHHQGSIVDESVSRSWKV